MVFGWFSGFLGFLKLDASFIFCIFIHLWPFLSGCRGCAIVFLPGGGYQSKHAVT